MKLIIFTDGSCNSKSKKCGYGVNFPNKELQNISLPFTIKPLTNQRAELYAIYAALSVATKKNNLDIHIYSDSKYSIECVTNWINTWKQNGWMTATKKPVKNLDIIKPINNIINKYKGTISFHHINSHTGNDDYYSINNDIADQLAKNGSCFIN